MVSQKTGSLNKPAKKKEKTLANSWFQFKQFRIQQDRTAMKVGTDGVLLGAWAQAPDNSSTRFLDIGTGTGLIALMLAQRFPKSKITAVEIDEQATHQAQENVANSPWNSRISVIQSDIRSFSSENLFDLIVTNPPYFLNSSSAPNQSRSRARHNVSLDPLSLPALAEKFLSDQGLFNLILPANLSNQMILSAEAAGLFPAKRTNIHPNPGKPAKRALLSFQRKQQPVKEDSLIIEMQKRHEYSPAYRNLTKDFYLGDWK